MHRDAVHRHPLEPRDAAPKAVRRSARGPRPAARRRRPSDRARGACHRRGGRTGGGRCRYDGVGGGYRAGCVARGGMRPMSDASYPMQRPLRPMHASPRCGARTRIGGCCRAPGMCNVRCRMHGGRSLSGTAHGRYRHGRATREAIAMRQYLAALVRDARGVLTGLQT